MSLSLLPSQVRNDSKQKLSTWTRIALTSLGAALLLGAFEPSTLAEEAKPFRTARLNYLTGDVRVQQSGSTSSSQAVVNLPLVEGAVLSTGEDGEAEVEFEDGSLLRLTPHSGAALVHLSVDGSGEYQSRISVLGGLAYVETQEGPRYHYVVDAGGEEISLTENSTLRINFDHPPAIISVLEGSAQLKVGDGVDVSVTAGQTALAGDAAEGGAYSVKEIVTPESWDQWNLDRDAAASSENSKQTDARSKYAGDQGYGWSDLDSNGNWYDVPGQGEVWQPDTAEQQADDSVDASAQSGFDPYSYGSWAYTPAGYVWASSYAWGWLPYRCGSWNYWGGFGWGWSPGVSCGAYGFGGYSDGGVFIGNAPMHYRKPSRPIPRPGPIHPILRGRRGPAPIIPIERDVHTSGSERVIAGNVVTPLPRVGGILPGQGLLRTSRSAAAGAEIRRNYPVDRVTNLPVTGIDRSTAVQGPTSSARAPWRVVQPAEGANQPIVQRPGYTMPESGLNRATPYRQPVTVPQRQSATPAAMPRSTQAPASRPAPAPASRPAAAPVGGHPK